MKKKYTDEELIQDALKYTTRKDWQYKILEDKIPNLDLADRENFYIEKYKTDTQFIVMNTNRGGGRGPLKRVSKKSDIVSTHSQ